MHLGRRPAARDERAVRHLLQHARPAPRRVLLVLGREVRRAHEAAGRGGVGAALADTHAPVHGRGQVTGVVREREAGRRGQRARRGAAQVGVELPRPDQDTRVEQVLRVEQRLERSEHLDRARRVHDGQQLGACAAVAVLAGQRAAVRGDELGRVLHERAQRRARAFERDVEPQVHAAVAEVPVGQPVDPVPGHQHLELAQVAAELGRRHGRVLEAGPGLLARGRAAAEPGAVLADPPHRGGLRAGREQRDRVRAGVGGQVTGPLERLVERLAADLDHEPSGARRQVGDGRGSAHSSDHVDQARVHAFDRDRLVRQQRRDRVGSRGHVRVAEDDEHGRGGDRHEPQRGLEDRPDGALGPHERLGEVRAVLGQQVLERVPRDLAGEPPQLGAQHVEVAVHELGEPGDGVERPLPRARGDAATRAVDEVQREHVVGGAAVRDGTRAARVVADHPAERRAGPRRRVRPEPQPVRSGGLLQRRHDRSRLDARGAGLRVDLEHPVHVPREVEHHARTDRVARDRRARTARGHRHARLTRHREGGLHVVGVLREDDDLRHDAVVRRVGRVLRTPTRGVVHRAAHRGAECGDDVGTHAGLVGHCSHRANPRTRTPSGTGTSRGPDARRRHGRGRAGDSPPTGRAG